MCFDLKELYCPSLFIHTAATLFADLEDQFSSVQSHDRLGRRGDMMDDSVEILFQSVLQLALVSSSGMGRDVHSFDVVHPAFPLPTTAPTSLRGALKDGFGEAVMACDVPEPCKLPSLDSCQKRFLWTHKKADLAPHPEE